MKALLLALLLVPLFSNSQTLALVDRKLMAPMRLTENTALSEVQSDLFPVYLQDMDSVIQALEAYRRWIDSGVQPFSAAGLKVIGHSSFFTDVYTFGKRERYRIVFSTGDSDYKTSMILVSKELSTRQALGNLANLIDYLRNNLAVVRDTR